MRIGLGIVVGIGGFLAFGLWAAVSMLVSLLILVLWILLMVKAFPHELFKLPIAAEIAEGISGK